MKANAIARAKRAIEEIQKGRMIILVDDENRENEGDLTMAAELVTPEDIAFMATKGCGLVCVALTQEQVERLGLPMMVEENRAPLGTAFTVSIEAADGVTTGISAADRAHTIRVAANPDSTSKDIVSPGHIFPLRAMPGGVLQRTGQTEGSVDLARLAGLTPAGVICEIMKPDGTMARMPDLEAFAEKHDLVIVSIADLTEYRLQKERLVERVYTTELTIGKTRRATFTAHVYRAVPGVRRREYVALVLGDVADGNPVPVRGHAGSLVEDVLGVTLSEKRPMLDDVIDAIITRGRGVIMYLPSRETIETELQTLISAEHQKHQHRERERVIREYGIGAQILLDLGVRKLQLISTRRLVGVEAWGFDSVEQIALEQV